MSRRNRQPILDYLRIARSRGHAPRRAVYSEYLGRVLARSECRVCAGRLACVGSLATVSTLLDYPCSPAVRVSAALAPLSAIVSPANDVAA